jgi:cyclic beta-1,2-glucan synthetase
MVQAHAWWRMKGLAVDLVIWNEERDVYRQRLQEQILGLISGSIESQVVDRPGGIFVRHAEQIAERGPGAAAGRGPRGRSAIGWARWPTSKGGLERRVAGPVPSAACASRAGARRRPTRPFVPSRLGAHAQGPGGPGQRGLQLFNGTGGFAPDGREYVIGTDG